MAQQVDVKAPWSAAEATEWDSQTFFTWLKANEVNPEFMRLAATATDAIFGQEPRDLSLLYVLFYVAASGDETHPGTFERNFQTGEGAQEERFVGGSQLISLRVAAALGSSVVLNAHVRQISQDAKGVKVQLDKGRLSAKQVIVAIPPALTARIDYEPLLPVLRDQLTQRAPMGSYAKVDAVYDRPFWREEGLTGQTVSLNGPVRVTFDSTPMQAAPACCSASSGAPTPVAGTPCPPTSAAKRCSTTSPTTSANKPATRSSTSRTPGRRNDSAAAIRSPALGRARCSTSAPPCASPSGASTGPERRPPTTGSVTWTARCARANGQPRRCLPSSRRQGCVPSRPGQLRFCERG